MKKLCLLLTVSVLLFACDRNDQETPEPAEFGYLSMNIVLSIEEVPASSRIEAVSTDNWRVTIFNADGTEAMVFDPYATAPAEVQLPTGEYYVEAHSNNFQEAAFENPYYFGRSANFQIDKEELTPIDINAELANSKVKINYTSNVTSTFQEYSGAVTVVSTGTTLPYVQGEIREGYFVSEPLSVVVDLIYTKTDGVTTITRQFTTNIDAQPKTLYNVNVDATLEDGEIVLNINVDETFTTEEINIGDVVVLPDPDPNTALFGTDVFPLVDGYIDDREFVDPLEIGSNSHYGYEVGVSDAAFVVFTETGGQQYFVGTNGASMKVYFTLYAPDQATFINGTFNYEDQNATTIDVVGGQPFFSAGELEFDDDGILPNGDFEDAEYSITGGTVTISGGNSNYTVEFDLETTGGQVRGIYTGSFQYLNTTITDQTLDSDADAIPDYRETPDCRINADC